MDEPVTEHAQLFSGGSMLVRPAAWDESYPLANWIRNKRVGGGKVYRRRVVIIEDWTEVPEE